MVTRRIRPLLVEGRVVHQVGLPFHWSFAGETVGGNANDLTSLLADPNVSMHEAKVVRLPGRARPADRPRRPTRRCRRRPGRTASRSPTRPTAAQPEGKFAR